MKPKFSTLIILTFICVVLLAPFALSPLYIPKLRESAFDLHLLLHLLQHLGNDTQQIYVTHNKLNAIAHQYKICIHFLHKHCFVHRFSSIFWSILNVKYASSIFDFSFCFSCWMSFWASANCFCRTSIAVFCLSFSDFWVFRCVSRFLIVLVLPSRWASCSSTFFSSLEIFLSLSSSCWVFL